MMSHFLYFHVVVVYQKYQIPPQKNLDLGEPRNKKKGKKGDIVPFLRPPPPHPPKRIKRGHLLSEKKA